MILDSEAARPCANRRGMAALSRPMPAWGAYGLGPVAVLIWTPLLLIEPVLDAAEHRFAAVVYLLCAVTAAAFATAAFAAYSRRPRAAHTVIAALAVQAAATLAATIAFGPHCYTLFVLFALALGSVAPPRWAPLSLMALAVGANAVMIAGDAGWNRIWVTTLTLLLAGFSTYGYHRLVSAIAELDATREDLALKAVDAERLRFSRDLHDLLGHTLSVMVVKAEAIRRLLPGDTDAAITHAGDIETTGRQSLLEVREAVAGYRETDVTRELDRARIALHAAGVTLRVDQTGDPLPSDVDTLFGWVVREATTNVIRHSRATACEITLSRDASNAYLTVADNGSGGAASPDPGRGLVGLNERAAELGGLVEATTSRRGFTLSAETPLRSTR
ncbi:MAG TPA: histidine kinase [Stackebrandtia sp.]|jgi:two-component system sensor histidine kinase DesK|uniref:sensor histidine kinase n=1 Tax=Stackebrandtia sp. TaxID=2023065 RepID=UPI002D515833|nr:histidine kinase [Stackebrandtia sp.]HZE39407.1 histidine kinase [Stackebrandtia sp.]